MKDYEFGLLLKLAADGRLVKAAKRIGTGAAEVQRPAAPSKVSYTGNGIVPAGSNVDFYLHQMQQASNPAPAPAAPATADTAPAAAAAPAAGAPSGSPGTPAPTEPAKSLSTPWYDPNKPLNGQDKVPDFGGDALYEGAYRARQRYEQALANNPGLAERMGDSGSQQHSPPQPSVGDPWTTPAAPGDGSPFGGGGQRPSAPAAPQYAQTPQMQRMSSSFDGLPVQRQMQLMRQAGVGMDEWMNASGADRDAFIRRAYQANQAARDRAASRQRRRVDAWRNAPGYVNGVKLSPAMLRARGLQ
jgi:hypothetical protein